MQSKIDEMFPELSPKGKEALLQLSQEVAPSARKPFLARWSVLTDPQQDLQQDISEDEPNHPSST